MDRTSANRGIPLGRGSSLPHPRSGSNLWRGRHTPIARHGHPGQAHCTSFTLAKWLCRTADRIDPVRVCGSHHCLGRGASAPDSEILCELLQRRQNAPIIEQRCAGLSSSSADGEHQIISCPRRTSSPLRQSLSFRYTQAIFRGSKCSCSSPLITRSASLSSRRTPSAYSGMGS